MQILKTIIDSIIDYLARKQQKSCLEILLFCSILALIFAYISQYVFGLEPCILCFYQRKPFYLIAILSFFGRFFLQKKSLQNLIIMICIALLAINASIAFYHAGVEKKIFAGPSTCSSSSLDEASDLEELTRKIEQSQAIRCDEPQFYFLKITMAGWNFVYCLGLIALILWLLIRFRLT